MASLLDVAPGTWIFSNWEKNGEIASNPPPGWSLWQCEGPNRAFYPSSGFPPGASGKEPVWECRRHEMQVQSLGGEDPLKEKMATHSSILAWRIPWTGTWRVHGVTKSPTRLNRHITAQYNPSSDVSLGGDFWFLLVFWAWSSNLAIDPMSTQYPFNQLLFCLN